MRLMLFFFRRYPWQSLAVLGALVLASAVDAIGLSVALPVLSLATRGLRGDGAAEEPSGLEATVLEALRGLGIEPELAPLMLLVGVAFWIKATVLLVAKRQVGYTVAHVATDLRLDLLRALLSARWRYYTRQPTGMAANAVATEADRASRAYLETAQIAQYSIEAVVYGGLAFAVSWQATIVTTLAAAITMGGLAFLVRMAGRAGRKQTRLLRSLLARLTDSLQVVKLLKATHREALIGPLLEEDTRKLNKALRRQVLSKEALRALQEPIIVMFLLVGVFVGLTVVDMPFATVSMVLLLFVRMLNSVNKTQRRYQHMVTDASALWSLMRQMEAAQREEEPAGGSRVPRLERAVTLEDVRLVYDDRAVLDGASLEIPAGRITAIVGPSGAGKTTIVDLVTGLVQPDAGSVRVDGVPLPEVDLRQWRGRIGYVPQEMLLLHDTVRVNVTLGDPDVGAEQVEEALRDAGAWEFVSKLPEGIDSSVGERGALLSGGQRQRVAIARALVHRPQLLILDEATAALDPENEAAVWATVSNLRGRTTVVAISHQPALTGVADRVYRIEDGHAVAVAPAAGGARSAQGVA